MLEQSESKTVSELMQLARTVAVLDRGAMEELMAKQDAAISAGLADESLRYHLLSDRSMLLSWPSDKSPSSVSFLKNPFTTWLSSLCAPSR